MRAAFEAWAAQYGMETIHDADGLYWDDEVQFRWLAWQEAARQERERTQELEASLSDLRYAVNASPSCQKGMLERCRCLKCGMLRSYDLLVAIRSRSSTTGEG